MPLSLRSPSHPSALSFSYISHSFYYVLSQNSSPSHPRLSSFFSKLTSLEEHLANYPLTIPASPSKKQRVNFEEGELQHDDID